MKHRFLGRGIEAARDAVPAVRRSSTVIESSRNDEEEIAYVISCGHEAFS